MAKLSEARLAAMIADATVDCYDEHEQVMGLFNMLEENLVLPFETKVLGLSVQVVSLELRGQAGIVAMCEHGPEHQAIELGDLPLPSESPAGAEWIEAYRHWARF